MYELRILASALDDLKRLDKPIIRRILSRLEWLTANFETINPESLSGELRDFYKFRVGDYRVIYQIISEEKVLVIHTIAHRRDIYRNL